MKYTGHAIIMNIDFSLTPEIVPGISGIGNAPSITFLLTGLKNETPESINKKLQELVGGMHGNGRVTITIESEDK